MIIWLLPKWLRTLATAPAVRMPFIGYASFNAISAGGAIAVTPAFAGWRFMRMRRIMSRNPWQIFS
jgi:hypothetical protein